MALFFIPYPFIEGSIPTMNDLQSGVLLGSIFFLSQTACFFALEKGDASMVTPIMGAKSIFVAFFVLLLGLSGTPSQATWIAVTLAAVAVALIGWPAQGGKVSFMAIGLGLLTAAGFGLTDAMVPSLAQQSTPSHVVSIMFLTVGSASTLLIPLVRGTFFKIRKKADIWMFASCIPMGIQAVLMSIAIAFYQVPAEANVFYACRGIWAIILAGWLGRTIGLQEGKISKPLLIRRLFGAVLLIAGIYFTPLGNS